MILSRNLLTNLSRTLMLCETGADGVRAREVDTDGEGVSGDRTL